MPPRVEFKHISKSFPGVKALTDISLTRSQVRYTFLWAKTVQANLPL